MQPLCISVHRVSKNDMLTKHAIDCAFLDLYNCSCITLRKQMDSLALAKYTCIKMKISSLHSENST